LCLLFLSKAKWTWAKKKLTAAGFVIKQDGDTEGTAVFDAASEEQARLAIKVAGIKRRRVLSEAQKEALKQRLERTRFAKT